MIDTLHTLMSSGRIPRGEMRGELIAIVTLFLDAGRDTGELRGDIAAGDVAATLAGVLVTAEPLDGGAQASRMLSLVLDGLRT